MKLVTRIFVRFFTERFFDEAAQTAYFLLLSVFPFLLFILSLIKLFSGRCAANLRFLETFCSRGFIRTHRRQCNEYLNSG